MSHFRRKWHNKILNTFKYLCRVCGGHVTSEYLTEGLFPNHLCRSCASSVCTLLIKVANNSIFNTLYGAVLCLLQYLKTACFYTGSSSHNKVKYNWWRATSSGRWLALPWVHIRSQPPTLNRLPCEKYF